MQSNANTGLLQAMPQKPCNEDQQYMRLWEMLTRNLGLQPRLRFSKNFSTYENIRLNKPALCFAVLFWILRDSPSEQHK